jgi:eukaryotic-like serine/threonine-protein kinase
MVWPSTHKLKNGRYTIEDVLRQGHLSVTYLARSEKGHRVVIKTPNDAAIPRADFDKLQERFVGEAFKLKDCQKSQYIVQVEEPFQEDGFWCIPMEYIAGTTLDKRSPLKMAEGEALRYVRQVGEALGVIHAQGLIHRDVSPDNIMRRSDDRGMNEAVLIDFGLVRDFNLSQSVTSTQKVTPFTPQELCLSKKDRGAYTDLYGLGAVLYALVTGDNPPMAMDRVPGEKLKFPAGVSAQVENAIEVAMALKGGDRPATVAQWLELLPDVNPEAKPEDKSSAKPLPPDERRKRTMEIVGTVLTALGVFFAALQGIPAALTYFFPKEAPPANVSKEAPTRSP